MGLVQESMTCGAEVVDRMEMGWDGAGKEFILGLGGGVVWFQFNEEIILSADFVSIEMNPYLHKLDGVARVAREVRALQFLQLISVLAQLLARGDAVQHVVGLL